MQCWHSHAQPWTLPLSQNPQNNEKAMETAVLYCLSVKARNRSLHIFITSTIFLPNFFLILDMCIYMLEYMSVHHTCQSLQKLERD